MLAFFTWLQWCFMHNTMISCYTTRRRLTYHYEDIVCSIIIQYYGTGEWLPLYYTDCVIFYTSPITRVCVCTMASYERHVVWWQDIVCSIISSIIEMASGIQKQSCKRVVMLCVGPLKAGFLWFLQINQLHILMISYYEKCSKIGKNSLIIDLTFHQNLAIFAMCSKH